MRTIDINDWTPFGEGGFGESYYHKSDRSIMLKMYMKDTDSVLAEREFERARAVLEMGILTPEAIELVTDGSCKGIIFERLIDKKSFNRIVGDDESAMEQSAFEFARCAKLLHSTPCNTACFKPQKELISKAIRDCAEISDADKQTIFTAIERVPNGATCLHGDFHFGNAILSRGKTYFIDLGDFAYGDPRLDLGEMKMAVTLPPPKYIEMLDHMPKERILRYWKTFLKYYFDESDPAKIDEIDQSLTFYMGINTAFMATKKNLTQSLIPAALKMIG